MLASHSWVAQNTGADVMTMTWSALVIRSALLLVVVVTASSVTPAQADDDIEAPRVTAALEQGRAAEFGIGVRKNSRLAISLYCDASTMGSPEGFFRVGRVLATAPRDLRNPRLANAYLALAARLGSQQALGYYDPNVDNAILGDDCGAFAEVADKQRFDLDAYLSRQPPGKQRIAVLIRNTARRFHVDERLALAIALVESNLEASAVSPKNAQGVMQLIPATQERFGVTRPFDPEQNIRGALAYLQWLHRRFAGDWRLIVAAYNAGEGAVDRYIGIPPYPETQQYVRRVLTLAGFSAREKS